MCVGTTHIFTKSSIFTRKEYKMDFSGFKIKTVKLIADGKEDQARSALEMFGYSPEEIETFIKEVKSDIIQAELGGDRTKFTNEISDGFNMVLPEITGDVATKLERLTENWTKMPTFTISLQRMIAKNEAGVEIVTFSWSKIPKFSGASATTSTPKTPTLNPDGTVSTTSKGVKPPTPYTSWQAVCQAKLPEVVSAYMAKHGNTIGFNARIPVRDAIRAGTITLDGWTEEMNY
jgi:hypothetical protein